MYKKKSMHFARVFFKYSMQDNFVKLFPNLVLMIENYNLAITANWINYYPDMSYGVLLDA